MNIAEELNKYRAILSEGKCKFCGKPVELIPSATRRADRDISGRSAAHYTSLFPNHAECELANRKKGDSEAAANRRKRDEESKVTLKTPIKEVRSFKDWMDDLDKMDADEKATMYRKNPIKYDHTCKSKKGQTTCIFCGKTGMTPNFD